MIPKSDNTVRKRVKEDFIRQREISIRSTSSTSLHYCNHISRSPENLTINGNRYLNRPLSSAIPRIPFLHRLHQATSCQLPLQMVPDLHQRVTIPGSPHRSSLKDHRRLRDQELIAQEEIEFEYV